MEHVFQLLAERPGLGRPSEAVAPGLRRFEYAKHVIFFRIRGTGIVISRVIHERRMPSPSLFR
jgi:toxin ParE1/3/4